MSDREKMLHEIGVLDFTVVELTLYLDTHPTDCDAMEYFNYYNRIRNQMKKEFSKTYYPLTTDWADSKKEWSWGAAPLPWEGVCG